MEIKGTKLHNVKSDNRGMVLRLILLGEKPNRSDISRELNLTKTTLTNIVSELIKDDIIEETELIDSDDGTLGRKSVCLDISKTSPVVCGLMIQRQQIIMTLADLKGNIIKTEQYRYDGLINIEQFKSALSGMYISLSVGMQRKIFAIGISSIGPIDTKKGLMLKPQGFFEEDIAFNIVEFIKDLTGIQTFLAHDVAAATIAEKLYGNAQEKNNFIFVSPITGLGVGFYLNSHLFDGENGQNGELGHINVNIADRKDNDLQKKCVEYYLTNDAIRTYAKEYIDMFHNHLIFTEKKFDVIDVILLAEEGDILSQLVLKKYCKYLGAAISVLTITLGVTNVYISNTPDSKKDYFEKLLEKELNNNAYVYDYQKTSVHRSKFGLTSSLYGAFSIIMNSVFKGELYFYSEQ